MKIESKHVKNSYVGIFTLLISLLPIISIYASGIPGMNLGELFLILFFMATLTNKTNINRSAPNILLIFSYYIIIFTLLSMLIDSGQINDVLVRSLRFIFYIFVIYYLSNKFFDFEFAINVIKKTSAIATTYIIIQTVAYRFFGIVFKGFISIIPLYISNYGIINYDIFYKTFFHRPTSFFLEPAHFSQYVLFGLAMYLFDEEFSIRKVLIGVYITLGIMISTSGQGILIALCIWVLFSADLLFNKMQSRIKRILGLFIPSIALILMPIILKTKIVTNNLSRFINNGGAVTARSEGYLAYFTDTDVFNKIFGAGFGNTPEGVWFSGLAYILYCTGIVGMVILLAFFIKYYLKTNMKLNKVFILITVALSASAEIINSYWIVFAFSIISYSNNICLFKDNKDLSE